MGLRDYFNSSTIHEVLFNVQLAKSVEAPEIETKASFDSRVALAELLGNTRVRSEQAREAYAQLAKEFPERWEVAAGWAEFAWRQRKLEESATHFARAMELGCKDLPSLLLYARVLGYSRRDQESAAVLRKAAELFPESDELNLELGAALVRTGNYGSALPALAAVKKVTAAQQAFRLYYNLAYAQYRLGNLPRALESLDKARSYTRIPAEIAELDRLRQSIDRPATGTDKNGHPQ